MPNQLKAHNNKALSHLHFFFKFIATSLKLGLPDGSGEEPEHSNIFHIIPKKKINFFFFQSLLALNVAGSWFQLNVAYDSSVVRSPGTPIRGNTSVRQAG